MANGYDVIVIGSGLGGLTAAALVAQTAARAHFTASSSPKPRSNRSATDRRQPFTTGPQCSKTGNNPFHVAKHGADAGTCRRKTLQKRAPCLREALGQHERLADRTPTYVVNGSRRYPIDVFEHA
jgi:hypothetical protein